MKINLKTKPTDEDLARVHGHLTEYNRPFMEHIYDEKFVLDIIEDNKLQAGMNFRIIGVCLSIEFLTVDDCLRGQGVGKQLMEKAENFAKEKGCQYASLYTLSFQARPFYEKLGYEVVYIQNDYPEVGQQKIYMNKNLLKN